MIKIIIGLFLVATFANASDVKLRVVGGNEISSTNTMWSGLVSLFIDGEPRCQGSLITKQWVVTSAHCISNRVKDEDGVEGLREGNIEASRVTILVGTINDTETGKLVATSEIYVHPQYHFVYNDIALIKLATPAADIIPMKINTELNLATSTTKVAGWGSTSTTGAIYPHIAQETVLPKLALSVCNRAESYAGFLKDTQFCAGYMEGNLSDACVGDSGAPLAVQDSAGNVTLVGIASFGPSENGQNCAIKNRPTVFTNVASYTDWIASVLGNPSISVPTSGTWYLKGTSYAISDMSTFDDVKIVLVYIDGVYRAYSPSESITQELKTQGYQIIDSIPANSGMWIKK